MNLLPFSIGLIREHWTKALWIALGALLCAPLAHCAGKRDARIENSAKLEAAAEKVRRAAVQAELAATIADATRRAQTKDEIAELQEIVDEAETGPDAGPATAGVLAKLRARRSH